MRIQHNVMAMNSYRNYSNNVSSLSKNLEKLSSGYKINRAGDDAAGLAISEKMRAQITGLQAAQKNVKDGISLVKTAEGAMQEIQDMLNRMDYLATQSANGTYDNPVDRFNLQKEVTQLKSEINRIADSANFNGIKLLDGSLAEGGNSNIDITGKATTENVAGTAGSLATANGITADNVNDDIENGGKLKLQMVDDQGNKYEISLTKKGNTMIDDNTGKVYTFSTTKASQTDVDNIVQGAVREHTGGDYKVNGAVGSAITIEASEKGAGTMKGIGASIVTADGVSTDHDLGDATVTDATSNKVVLSGTAAVSSSMSASDAKANIFTVNGQKFALTTDTDVKKVKALLGEDVTLLVGDDLGSAAGQLAQATGLTVTKSSATELIISARSGKGLNLQIGDTAETFNRLNVSIGDMHTDALGISGLDISSQTGAAAAITAIKAAINSVSSVRGDLGAYQNRLEHTQKNLSVMEENIQDAESNIRDTDVASEMMSYTKNNILIQSAQAMLAQANAVPQGVLQLLG